MEGESEGERERDIEEVKREKKEKKILKVRTIWREREGERDMEIVFPSISLTNKWEVAVVWCSPSFFQSFPPSGVWLFPWPSLYTPPCAPSSSGGIQLSSTRTKTLRPIYMSMKEDNRLSFFTLPFPFNLSQFNFNSKMFKLPKQVE